MLTVRVNLSALRHNLRYVRSRVGDKVIAVVKANAYGHGAKRIAQEIENEVTAFAVATINEANELVSHGIKRDVLVLGCEREGFAVPNVIPTVCCRDDIDFWSKKANRVAIKVNTGMNRLGCNVDDVCKLVGYAHENALKVDSVYSHLFNSENERICLMQLERFNRAVNELPSNIKRHICASNCLSLPQNYHFDAVRVGLALYGYGESNLRKVSSVCAPIVRVCDVKRGEYVSYGDCRLDYDARLATVRIGYGDGLRRSVRVPFIVNGERRYSVGNVCMDMCMVDVTGLNCDEGDIAVLDREQLLSEYGIIEYEALTLINERAKREYFYDEE